MDIVAQIKDAAAIAIKNLYQLDIAKEKIQVNETKPEFEGDYTIVLFGFIKELRKSPDVLGNEMGNYLTKANPALFEKFNLIKGFLNLTIPNNFWLGFIRENFSNTDF